MNRLLFVAAIVSLLAGCAVHTRSGSVIIDPDSRADRGGVFCPPGQAKKGNC